jgi:uncharacterized damage-inducible protein DinB
MSRATRLAKHIERTVTGPMWHGPSLAQALEPVTHDAASARPIAGAHSIWEIVRHVTTWAEIARERLHGQSLGDPAPERDWPPVPSSDPQFGSDPDLHAWRLAIEQLAFAHRMLAADVRDMTDEALDAKVKDLDYPVGVLLDGVVEHGVYHAGQIVLLSKASA